MSHIRPDLEIDSSLYQSTLDTKAPTPEATSPGVAWRRFCHAVVAQLAQWQAHRRARRDLARLDARSLRDLGVAPEDIVYELSQPFWRPLRDWRR
jgi:uncharacterized protein YjiS (DUF1127 family)